MLSRCHTSEFRITPSSKRKAGESRALKFIKLGIIRDLSGKLRADRPAGNDPMATLRALRLDSQEQDQEATTILIR